MRVLRNALLFGSVLLSQIVLAESGWQTMGDLVRLDERANQVELAAQRGKLRIIAVAPDVVRVTYSPNGKFPPDQSFAVLRTHFQQTPSYESRKQTPRSNCARISW